MRFSLATLVVAIPQLAAAADLEIPSRIDRVTVFPDGAAVTRSTSAELPTGATTLILRGLPASLDPSSIRVEAAGDAQFAIGAVDVRTVPGDPKPGADEAMEVRIRGLRDEREAIAGRIAALDTKKATIERFAQVGPEKISPEARPLEVSQWQMAWDVVGQGLTSVNEEARALRSRARDLDGEIAALERARPQQTRPGAPKRDVAVALETVRSGRGEIRVTYRVAGAGWASVYDARLDTGGAGRPASLELVRRAQVTQRTGEDWDDVALAFSTVQAARRATPPDLQPLQVRFYEPRPVPTSGLGRPESRAAAEPAAQDRLASMADARRAPEIQASVDAGAFQATFLAPGRVSVPQDGSQKNFALTRRTARPSLLIVSAPVVEQAAYLQASFGHDEEAPLLPGEVSLQRDGTYVGKSRLRGIAPGEVVELGFGVDDRVKVSRVPVRRSESEPGWIAQSKTDLREFKTTVRNLHAQPMRIVVYDRLPFAENTSITVEQSKDTTPPTEKQVGDKRGVVSWTHDYAPGEARDIRLGYRLRWPAERDVVFEPKPLPGS